MKLEPCPNCGYTSFERSAYCPVCGIQLTYPLWKKIGAWVLLILIGYGWVRCNVKFMGGFGKAKPATSYQLPVTGYGLRVSGYGLTGLGKSEFAPAVGPVSRWDLRLRETLIYPTRQPVTRNP